MPESHDIAGGMLANSVTVARIVSAPARGRKGIPFPSVGVDQMDYLIVPLGEALPVLAVIQRLGVA